MTPDLSDEAGRRSPPRILRTVVMLAGLLLLIFIITIELTRYWPPDWLQRKSQRENLAGGVDAVGGLSVLERA